MAERLRRKIRNLLGFSRAGSSPAGVVFFCVQKNIFQSFFFIFIFFYMFVHCKSKVTFRMYHEICRTSELIARADIATLPVS